MTEHTPLAQRAGLYLHVPFCQRKCPYCGFSSRPPRDGDFACYFKAVLAQLHTVARLPEIRELRFATVFFGGGTPSLLPAGMLASLLHACTAALNCAADREISVEVNPGTIGAPALLALRKAGFNRLSVGVQSFCDAELRRLGRIHSAAEAGKAVAMARAAGFANISLDLMYGLPGQRAADWQHSLEAALALEPQHLALYELTPEAGTSLAAALERGAIRLPEEDEVLAMMAVTRRLMAGAALARYEISNYARPGLQCRHNLNYWENGFYLGLGPGAVSAFGGGRFAIPPGLARYRERAASGQPAWDAGERLDREAAFRETVIMGLRLIRGVSAAALQRRFALDLRHYYGPVLERLLAQKLVVWHGDLLALSDSGLLLANQVMAELV